MPSFGPRCSWRRRNSRKYLLLKEHRRRLTIANSKGAALLDHFINSIVPFEDQDTKMNSSTSPIPAGDENKRGDNVPNPAGEINNVVPSGNQPPPARFPRGCIGSGRISIRIHADNVPLMHDYGQRRDPIQLINAPLGPQNYYVGESPGFARFFGVNRLLAREDNVNEEDTEDEEEEEEDDDSDDSDDGTDEEEDDYEGVVAVMDEEDDYEEVIAVMDGEEEKDDFTNTPSDLDEM
ncbi:hypothetical protein MLD38_035272 [Melastoma candidum]|uniref:Uncharacterized protein n=1 Tax=Melastoma candidum TaxID=119954 RepID=A0ACB9MD27_9MYRT|nr:hypothetical protein MLD38_035272 [Melastoma candidum]